MENRLLDIISRDVVAPISDYLIQVTGVPFTIQELFHVCTVETETFLIYTGLGTTCVPKDELKQVLDGNHQLLDHLEKTSGNKKVIQEMLNYLQVPFLKYLKQVHIFRKLMMKLFDKDLRPTTFREKNLTRLADPNLDEKTKNFIVECRELHGDTYDYSLTIYRGSPYNLVISYIRTKST
ncbi:MAG: hypothetical protein ACYCQJ_13140 [Nitrososphaerales archaeon]